jgi:(p)ppGpp synthase/HD superfamily hydrolase
MNGPEDIAKAYMMGTREGGKRQAWEHPRDVVELVLSLGSVAPVPDGAEGVAWLHDVLEDGVHPSGARFSWEDLEKLVPADVVDDVVCLTKREAQPKNSYLASLSGASPRARLVKCADRICNLREGAPSFSPDRWARYVGETYLYVLPLAVGLPHEAELRRLLCEAAGARPVL